MNTAQKASQEINEILLKYCPEKTNSESIIMRIELLEVVERAIDNYSEDIKRLVAK